MPEDSLIYDTQQALWDGRAFLMTYVGWENVLADMGQAYKDWLRGDNGMDGPGCIARMDELQTGYLNNLDTVYFCESTADFTLEDGETYRIAFTANSYTEEVGQTYNVQVEEGSLSTFVRTWLDEQKTVSPDGNPWEQ